MNYRKSVLVITILTEDDGKPHQLDELSDIIYRCMDDGDTYMDVTTEAESEIIDDMEARKIVERNGDEAEDYNLENALDWRYHLQEGDEFWIEAGTCRRGPHVVKSIRISEGDHKDEDKARIRTECGQVIDCFVHQIK